MEKLKELFEPIAVHSDGLWCKVKLFPLQIGDTIEGKRELLRICDIPIADITLINRVLREEDAFLEFDFLVVADASVEPIPSGMRGSIMQVPASGICKGCPDKRFFGGLMDFHVPKRADDPTVLCIMGIVDTAGS